MEGKDLVQATCQLCLPKNKIIKGSTDTITNYLKHLKRKHPDSLIAYNEYKEEHQRKNKSRKLTSTSSNLRQATLGSLCDRSLVTQEEFNKKIVHFVINTISAVSIIEHPTFKALFDRFNVHIMGRKATMNTISHIFKDHQKDIKLQISKQKFLCSTADKSLTLNPLLLFYNFVSLVIISNLSLHI